MGLDSTSMRQRPKAELHLHLDGSLRPDTIEELARTDGLVPADAPPGAAIRRVRVAHRAGLLEALEAFDLLLPLLQTPERLARVTRELVEDLAADGVRYVELRFCPRLLTGSGMSIARALGVACEAAADAETATGTRARIIACLMGGFDSAWNAPIIDAALGARADGVVGVDLAGTVEGRSPDWIDAHARLFARAREGGLGVTIHAGEAEPAEAITVALDRYGAERIGHGTSLIDDPDLLGRVADAGIVVESCPRSNYWTRSEAQLPDLAAHPVGRMLRSGVRVCLNTDDRSLFGNDLSSEFAVTAEAQGFDGHEIDQLVEHGFAGAFVNPR